MTPTAQIAAIRQRQIRAGGFSDGDLDYLLTIWDARESALRALVAQIEARAKECYDISLCVDDFAHSCIQQAKATAHLADAAELERLLESEQ